METVWTTRHQDYCCHRHVIPPIYPLEFDYNLHFTPYRAGRHVSLGNPHFLNPSFSSFLCPTSLLDSFLLIDGWVG